MRDFSREYITVEQIAENLGISDDLVRKWIREKKLPAYQFGKEYRVKIVEYEKFVERRRTMEPE
jgi:excisionase family DNA binding protein